MIASERWSGVRFLLFAYNKHTKQKKSESDFRFHNCFSNIRMKIGRKEMAVSIAELSKNSLANASEMMHWHDSVLVCHRSNQFRSFVCWIVRLFIHSIVHMSQHLRSFGLNLSQLFLFGFRFLYHTFRSYHSARAHMCVCC